MTENSVVPAVEQQEEVKPKPRLVHKLCYTEILRANQGLPRQHLCGHTTTGPRVPITADMPPCVLCWDLYPGHLVQCPACRNAGMLDKYLRAHPV